MKKIISLLLVAAMAVSVVPMALATTNYTNGTQVVYQATGAEAYTVTVPAKLAPGEWGQVKAEGTWASNRMLTVTADESVTLANSINQNDTKELDVLFGGIGLAGNNTVSVSQTNDVYTSNISDALFGTWSGKFNYNVDMVNVGDMIEFVVYRPVYGDDGQVIKDDNGWVVKAPNTVQAKAGMTWGEWIASEYNTVNVGYGDGGVIGNYGGYMSGPNGGPVYNNTVIIPNAIYGN